VESDGLNMATLATTRPHETSNKRAPIALF
jgi:hypothetical protein